MSFRRPTNAWTPHHRNDIRYNSLSERKCLSETRYGKMIFWVQHVTIACGWLSSDLRWCCMLTTCIVSTQNTSLHHSTLVSDQRSSLYQIFHPGCGMSVPSQRKTACHRTCKHRLSSYSSVSSRTRRNNPFRMHFLTSADAACRRPLSFLRTMHHCFKASRFQP